MRKRGILSWDIMTRVLLGMAVLSLSLSGMDASGPQYLNDTRRIPEIIEGQQCIKGHMYRMGCNTCHCGANNALLCTKMACFNPHNFQKFHPKILRESACTPGQFYKKGCKKCFCTEKKGLMCGADNCELVNKTYTNPGQIREYSPPEFYHLRTLPHQGSECQPGATYRIDCNVCLCLSTGNLMCEKLLCPSYDDVYRIKAKEMSGQPCENDLSENCFKCKCVTGKYACSPHAICKHSDGRRVLHGEYPSKKDRNFIDLDQMSDDCEPGMVYKVHCNKCYCQEDRSLRCTQKTCLNYEEVQRLKKLRLKLEGRGRLDTFDGLG